MANGRSQVGVGPDFEKNSDLTRLRGIDVDASLDTVRFDSPDHTRRVRVGRRLDQSWLTCQGSDTEHGGKQEPQGDSYSQRYATKRDLHFLPFALVRAPYRHIPVINS